MQARVVVSGLGSDQPSTRPDGRVIPTASVASRKRADLVLLSSLRLGVDRQALLVRLISADGICHGIVARAGRQCRSAGSLACVAG
jgi:hypothetical protein